LTDTITRQAELFIRQANQKNAPFLLSVSYKAPHVQDELPIGAKQFMYQVRFGDLYQNETFVKTPEQANNDYNRLPPELQNSLGRTRYIGKLDTPENYSETLKNYYRLVSGMDESIGRINQLLKELKIDDSTIIIFTSDNGMMFGEHGLAEKWCMYEASIRIPLIIYDPKQIYFPAGKRVSELTLNVDVFPTILSLAKVQAGGLSQGLDLTQITSGDKKRDFFFYVHDLDHPQIPKTVGIRTDRFKYFQLPDAKSRYEALFDLSNDPHEFSNLVDDSNHRPILSELRQRMQQEWARLSVYP